MPLKPTPIKLDTGRFLFYRSEDMESFEEMLGGEAWTDALNKRGEKRLRLILWAGMRHREEKISPARVGEMLDAARREGVTLADLWHSVGLALQNSGFLPPVTNQHGVPTMTEGSTLAPAPSDTGA